MKSPLAEQEHFAAKVARYPLTGEGERLPVPQPFAGRSQQRDV
jgi:hypothetical protein